MSAMPEYQVENIEAAFVMVCCVAGLAWCWLSERRARKQEEQSFSFCELTVSELEQVRIGIHAVSVARGRNGGSPRVLSATYSAMGKIEAAWARATK